MVSIQNVTGLGMSIDTSSILLIDTCSFSRNGQDPTESYNGNLKIVAFQNDVHYMIKSTNITTGIGSKGTLSISLRLCIYNFRMLQLKRVCHSMDTEETFSLLSLAVTLTQFI